MDFSAKPMTRLISGRSNAVVEMRNRKAHLLDCAPNPKFTGIGRIILEVTFQRGLEMKKQSTPNEDSQTAFRADEFANSIAMKHGIPDAPLRYGFPMGFGGAGDGDRDALC